MTLLLALLILLFIFCLFYTAGLLRLARGFRFLEKQKRSKREPRISVIVCAHNEQQHLPQCITHLQNQKYPPARVEFILVNDRSTDATASIIEEAAKSDQRFKGLTITDRLPDFAPKKRAIDLAIRQAAGEIICLTDADGRPKPGWLKSIISYFDEETDMVIGYAPYNIRPAGHWVKRLLALEYLSHAAVAAASTGLGYPATCVGTNMAYRKSLYQKIGGFGPYKNYISGDDDLFLSRVREAGTYKIKYAAEASGQVYNDPPQLWKKFLHQRMRYASKGLHYPFKLTLVLLLYFLFDLFLIMLTAIAIFRPAVRLPFLGLLLIKGLSEFWFMFRAAQTLNDRRNLIFFPLAALLHIPYVVIFAFLGQFNRYRWAEETAEAGIQEPAADA